MPRQAILIDREGMDGDGYPICDFWFLLVDDLWDGVRQAGSGRMLMIL